MSALHPLARLQHLAAPHGGEAYDLGDPHAAAQASAANKPEVFRSKEQQNRADQLGKLLPNWLIVRTQDPDKRLRFYVVRRATASSKGGHTFPQTQRVLALYSGGASTARRKLF